MARPPHNLTFVHLSGPRQGEVDVVSRLPAEIGSQPGVDVLIPGIAPRHATLMHQDGDFLIHDGGSDLGTFLAGEAVREAALRSGDVIELGIGGPRLELREEPGSWLGVIGRAGSGLVGRRSPLRAVIRTTHARTRPAIRVFVLVALAVIVGVLALEFRESRKQEREIARLREALRLVEEDRKSFQERIDQERRRAAHDRRALEDRVAEFRQREERLTRQISESTGGQVQTLKQELMATRERLATLESERLTAERVIRDFGGGVCLIQGAYAFYDSAGRPLRYQVDERGRAVREADGSVTLDTSGAGPIHTVDYLGTGFLVDPKGLILTNHHVAEPWWNDTPAERLIGNGFKPHFIYLRGFFPRLTGSFDLARESHSETVDLALLKVDLKGRRVPALPLDMTGVGAVAGQPVVVVGYPTGLEAILAKADGATVREILEGQANSSERVAEALSQRGLIRPSSTQGHIGDVTKTDIVFDAPTTQGGSGGPIFNRNGQVIAVEYAVLPKFGGNSFGVPIGYAQELLKAPRKKTPTD